MNKLTRKDIVACNWSWAALGKAKAYHHCIVLLRSAGCNDKRGVEIATTAYKNMMRFYALDAVRLARAYTPQR